MPGQGLALPRGRCVLPALWSDGPREPGCPPSGEPWEAPPWPEDPELCPSGRPASPSPQAEPPESRESEMGSFAFFISILGIAVHSQNECLGLQLMSFR